MRMFNKVIAGVAVAATLALTAGVAMADPMNAKSPWVKGPGSLYYPGLYHAVTPRDCDVVGSGSNTLEYLFDQYSLNYNAAVLKAHKKDSQTTSCAKFPTSFFYSWDALQNAAATATVSIAPKPGCAKAPRPNGSSAGITALAANETVTVDGIKYFCWDYARSSRARSSSDPTDVTFVPLALDNVTYASVSGSNAPKNLTTADLKAIYLCKATKWTQVGGKSSATIHPLLPQPHSGTLAFFENAIGVPVPGPCVVQPTTLEENEGVNAIFTGKNAKNEIIPFSAGKWVAQAYHSPACASSKCPADTSGVFIKCKEPKAGQNFFGCDVNGVLHLNSINGTSPVKGKALNPRFTIGFVRALYAVVRGTDSIPAYLAPFFGRKNSTSFCNKTNQTKVIPAYGFEANPSCGVPNAF
jgi:ABC-type phosphate transport system substrate-binding protein